MSAGKYSFIIEQGATTNLQVDWSDANQNRIDLTGYTAMMQLRPSVDSELVYISLSSTLQADGTGINMSGSNGSTPLVSGSLAIYISAASSSMFDFTEAYYDLELTNGNTVTRLLEGKAKLSKNVTR